MNSQWPKPGVKILADVSGEGPELRKGDRVRVRYAIRLNHGDCVRDDETVEFTIGDREFVAGFRYGLERMRVGGTRVFRASPHLCYRDEALPAVPKNAVLVFEIKQVELIEG